MSIQAWNAGARPGRCAVGLLVRLVIRQRVDDTIVVLRSIQHYIEAGLSPTEAALTVQRECQQRPSVRLRAPLCGGVS
jgi:hypothetical protein